MLVVYNPAIQIPLHEKPQMTQSSFQEIALKLQDFWASRGCVIT